MTESVKTLQIISSPFDPGIGSAFGALVAVRSPRSARSVTVMVNPAAKEYQAHPVDSPQLQVRQRMVMSSTDDTITMLFDLDATFEHSIVVHGQHLVLRLLKIGPAEREGQHWPCYDFMVTSLGASSEGTP